VTNGDQDAEEQLKSEVMNARTAKKMRLEMEMGLQFCSFLHSTVRQILLEMDRPDIVPPPTLGGTTFSSSSSSLAASPRPAGSGSFSRTLNTDGFAHQQPPSPRALGLVPPSPLARASSTASQLSQASTHGSSVGKSSISPGNSSSSTLRKLRKKRVPPSTEPSIPPELESSAANKRLTKKQQVTRLFEWLRFRPLKAGDLVAARLTSRDLWILAKVCRDYGHSHSTVAATPGDFLQLSTTRRDQLFQREKVAVTDVEDAEERPKMVPRNLVLPLPRSFGEASEWCSRYRKGSRVYAMYPQTTSLYAATVVDSTSYCRDEDDICVVEFDGDEPDDDESGGIPRCHVPARFVCLIPKEFPASSSAPSGHPSSSSSSAAAVASNRSRSAQGPTLTKRARELPIQQRQKREAAAATAVVAAAPSPPSHLSISSMNDSSVTEAAAAALSSGSGGGGDLMNVDLDDLDFEGGLPGLDFDDDLDFSLD
jgi:hypothetical protein